MDVNSLYIKALNYSKKGQFSKAILHFNKILLENPSKADVLSDRAVAKFHLKDIEGALTDLNLALELEPENPYRYASRAYIREKNGDTMGAIDDYRKSIELDPENAVTHNSLAMLEEKLAYTHKTKPITFDQVSVPSEESEKAVTSLLEELNIPVNNESGRHNGLWQQMLTLLYSREERNDFMRFLFRFFSKKK